MKNKWLGYFIGRVEVEMKGNGIEGVVCTGLGRYGGLKERVSLVIGDL